jgi:hypothetical protein
VLDNFITGTLNGSGSVTFDLENAPYLGSLQPWTPVLNIGWNGFAAYMHSNNVNFKRTIREKKNPHLMFICNKCILFVGAS